MFGGIHLRAPVTPYTPSRRPIRTLVARVVSWITRGVVPIDELRFAGGGRVMFRIAGGAGEAFGLGETKIRPGTYIRFTTGGSPPSAVLPKGTAAAVIRSDWGPVAEAVVLEGERQIAESFGDGGASGTLDVARRLFRGGAKRVIAVRVGDDDGDKAELTVTSAAPANLLTLTAKHPGTRANDWSYTHRASLADPTMNEILIYEGTTLLETIRYSPTGDNSQNLVDAVNDDSLYLDATFINAGDPANVSGSDFAGGTDPTIDGTVYADALNATETYAYNVLVVDTEDDAIHASVEAFVDRVRSEGKLIFAVVGEPTSVSFADRKTNATALNNPGMAYVGNGFKTAEGDFEGTYAAAQVAGMIARASLLDSLTNAVVDGATELIGPLTNSEREQAINAGMLTFITNPAGQIVVEYGITTLVTLSPDLDAGWKKIRRTRIRDELAMQIVADVDSLRGKVSNGPSGRNAVQGRVQGTINRFIGLGALQSGSATVDEGSSEGDSVYLDIVVEDLDAIEKLYLTFEFNFSAVAA